MEKKKRSFGSLFLGFIRGLITLILILLLICSVGINILFYSSESTPKLDVDFLNMHYTFFVNNSSELANIDEGAFVIVDHKSELVENRYVLCSIGSGYKTVLCLSGVTQNENGTLSYNLRGDKQGSDADYSVHESRILGTVFTKIPYLGDLIQFARTIKGIAALMALPAFLLIIFSIQSIKRKKSRYEDDLLEADIFMEGLRKAKRNEEKRAEELRKKNIQADQGITPASPVSSQSEISYEEYTRQAVIDAPEDTSVSAAPVHNQPEVNKYEYVNFEDEAAQKAIEIKKALLKETSEKTAPAEPEFNRSSDPAVNNVLNRVQNQINAEKQQETSIYNEQLNPSAPVFQPEPEKKPETPAAVQPEPVRFVDYTEAKRTEAANPAPVPAPETPAPVRKKEKPPVKKIDAESIDDLIRILEEEKKRLG